MELLISDANILIDMAEGRLLALMFGLPYQFRTPDILFEEELREQHADLLELGLGLLELSSDSMRSVTLLAARYRRASRNDCLALALAQQEKCPLLTGDKRLREAAQAEKVEVKGTLWLVEMLVHHEFLSVTQAKRALKSMQTSGRRLPWNMAADMLDVMVRQQRKS